MLILDDKIYNICSLIEQKEENMPFSSKPSRQERQSSSGVKDGKHDKDYKKKRIKKRRKQKSQVQISRITGEKSLLDNLVALRAQPYFQQSKVEAFKKCLSTIRSSVHIKNIFGKDEDVFDLRPGKQSSQMANQYISLCKHLQEGKIYKLKLRRKRENRWSTCIFKQEMQQEKILLLNREEEQILQKRAQIMPQVDSFLQRITHMRPEETVDNISRQIIALCKLNAVQESQIEHQIRKILTEKEDSIQNFNFPSLGTMKLQNQYCRILMMKNLRLGLSEDPFEYINYFRQIEIREQNPNDQSPLPLLDNAQQFRTYLKIKKPKKHKPEEQSLKTACSACTSNFEQSENHLVRCSECGVRVHRLCHHLQTKCGRCSYVRKTQNEKEHRPYCCLCLQDKKQGLSLEIIKKNCGEWYAHTFCLLFTGNWRIEQQRVSYSLPDSTESIETCRTCNRKGGIVIKSKCCLSYYHPLCAFLQGYSMKLGEDSRVEIKCCDCDERERVKYDRRFRLNFQKMFYKQTQQALSFLDRE